MDILHSEDGGWVILHAGKIIDINFPTDLAAWSWADEHIDDQVFDGPNQFSPPLKYREATHDK